jgi:myo-inositol-1(or 4)-monophosphatase
VTPPVRDLLALAERAAAAGAAVHRAWRGKVLAVTAKSSPTDVVTEVDREAERAIVDIIRAARPDDGILAEEGTSARGQTDVRWVIDPLDGTTNYVYAWPAYAVSIGIEIGGQA